MGRITFRELAKARFKDKRNVVISEAYDNETGSVKYAVSEQLITEENGSETKVFLKCGLGFVDEKGMLLLLDCVLRTCESIGLIDKFSECSCGESCSCKTSEQK